MRTRLLLLSALLAGCYQQTGVTTLIGAARNGDVEAIHALAKAGADLGERGGVNGWTPLMHAIHKNRKTALAALLEDGADPNERSSGGSTPLMMAAGYGYADMVRLLLAHGADPRMVDAHGDSALTLAISGVPDIDKFTLGSCQGATVKALLDAAPDLKVRPSLWSRMTRLVSCMEAIHPSD
jgi:hypothetical protein